MMHSLKNVDSMGVQSTQTYSAIFSIEINILHGKVRFVKPLESQLSLKLIIHLEIQLLSV